MRANDPIDDTAASLLERRWFAARSAAAAVQVECEILARVRDLADDDWRLARLRLMQLEALSDALGDEWSAFERSECLKAPVKTRSAA